MKRYFLGLAAGYGAARHTMHHVFTRGRARDPEILTDYLSKHYGGTAYTTKNGRSALALALKGYLSRGDKVLVTGFTCYAVYEAVKAASLTPVFVDISAKDLNYDYDSCEKAAKDHNVRAIIIQNTLGHPADVARIEKIARKHHLIIIEDLAHCTGIRYADGREAGTVGAATALSFGKDKMIDTVNGGAVIFRAPTEHKVTIPTQRARASDTLRARFYPLLAGLCRGLTGIHLGGLLMKLFLKIHWVEKSADNRLDLTRMISRSEARLAYEQFQHLRPSGERPIREFFLVNNRGEVLQKLKKSGYYFDSLWYKSPVAPSRYYAKVHFPEDTCPRSLYVAEHIINLPTYYSRGDLKRATQIIKPYLISEAENAKMD
jgi:dTDP-4-amino-4,6-dideoxygalactose transaminase